jgi:hypothetical protein
MMSRVKLEGRDHGTTRKGDSEDQGNTAGRHQGQESQGGVGSASEEVTSPTEEVKPLEGDVGEKEPDTGRVITQPTDNLAKAQQLATAAAPELKDKLATVTKGIEGADVDGVREEKDRARSLEKSKKQDQPVETISDLLAGRIAVDSPHGLVVWS